MHISILLPFATARPEEITPYASLVEWTGVRRLWQGQSLLVEPHQGFSHLSGGGVRVPLGIGVTLMPLRHPFEAAVQARSLARMTGQPLTVGYGPGSREFQESLLGAPYASPLTAAREYVGIVRRLLAGGVPDVEGEYFSCRRPLEAGPSPRVEVALGVLGVPMAQVAGQVADAAVTWLAPAHYIAERIVPALAEGAAGRTRRPRVVAVVPVALARPGRDTVEVVLASSGRHVRQPHYARMLRGAGIDVSLDAAEPDAARALLAGGAFVSGDLDQVLDGLSRFEAAGVDELVLNVTGVHRTAGAARALAELRLLLDEALPGVRRTRTAHEERKTV